MNGGDLGSLIVNLIWCQWKLDFLISGVLSIFLFGICSLTTEIYFCLLLCAADLSPVALFSFSWFLPSPQICALPVPLFDLVFPAAGAAPNCFARVFVESVRCRRFFLRTPKLSVSILC
jgi:hypothetical protein